MLLAPYRFSLAPPPNDQELTPHKYWRLYITEADSANSIGIRQIEFRATPGGPTQSTGGTASASTEYDSYRQAQFAFDDDAGSTIYFWSSTAGLPQWIAYEHAAPVVVREVMIKARNDGDTYGTGPENFIVQSSDNGTVWNDEWTVTGATGWTNGEVRTFERPAVATGLLAGLAHWYELDEASGTRMDSVRGAHLSIAGTVVGAPSPVGTGATIGGGAYMFHTGSIVADLSNTDLTIAGVFNGSSAATGLVAFGNGDINGRQVWVLTENGNFVVTMSTGGNSNTVVLTVPGKGDNGAHRFIMWRDRAADVIGVQIDGEAPVTVPFDGDLTLFAPGTRQLMMGQLGSNIYTGGAQLDGVGVWTRALSADERTQLYNDGAWRTFAQLG
ncbi:MAG TPA: discoidin domain-containing protein, partial [Pyrinomonadaceae bacterium]